MTTQPGKKNESPQVTAKERSIDLAHIFSCQRQGFLEKGAPSYTAREQSLKRLHEGVLSREQEIVDAVVSDFGSRSRHETLLSEVFASASQLQFTRKHLKKWMKPRRRHVSLTFQPARARVLPQPKGVVAILSPWNYPFYLTLVPLTYAIAAGNRVLIKPSEKTPATTQVMEELFSEVFSPDEVALVKGGPEVGRQLCQLPLDHLFFTGSVEAGRSVMQEAAKNLTPVTLELGGKSPVILHESFPLADAVKRIVAGKYLNSGQTCVAPDYVFVPRGKLRSFVSLMEKRIKEVYPTVLDNPDYTSLINQSHVKGMLDVLEEARRQGTEVVEINPGEEVRPADCRKVFPTLILEPPDESRAMQGEIFGPVLPVKGYDDLEDVLAFVNNRPRPLALYYFDLDKDRARRVLEKTTSGSACINETVLQAAQDDLPLGGVGMSGMGSYHGEEGFLTFSHCKSVLLKGKFNSANLISPPYGPRVDKILRFLLSRVR